MTVEKTDNLDSIFVRLADVKKEEVKYLWDGYIPLGTATMLVGHPEICKTLFLCDIAARLSSKLDMPTGTTSYYNGSTLYFTLEDDLATTIRSRIEAAGGNPFSIFCLNNKKDRFLTIPDDFETIKNICRCDKIRLVVFDPIFDFTSRGYNYNTEKVRDVYKCLNRLAHDIDGAVIAVRHLRKSESKIDIHNVLGSIGIGAAIRHVLQIDKYPPDENIRILKCIKCNIAQKPQPLGFSVVDLNGGPRIVWQGPLDEAIGLSKTDNCCKFLKSSLFKGPVYASDIFKLGKDLGYTEHIIRKSSGQLGVVIEKELERSGKSLWSLPEYEGDRRIPIRNWSTLNFIIRDAFLTGEFGIDGLTKLH